MSIRCAICGSKRVTLETRKEGYDLKKGVVGTALIGIPGALAGMNGKDSLYYHCADCGHVMNKPMLSVESDWIDMLLESPDSWKEQLKEKKAKYKNIEWEDYDAPSNSVSNLTSEDKREEMEDDILSYLNQMGTWVEEHKIKRKLGLNKDDWNWDFETALNVLYDNGKIDKEYMNSECSYCIVRNIEDIKTKKLQRKAWNELYQIEGENRNKWIKMLCEHFEPLKPYTWEEMMKSAKNLFAENIVTDNEWLIHIIATTTLGEMGAKKILVKENDVYHLLSYEEIKRIWEEIEAKKQKETEERNRKHQEFEDGIKEKILRYLNENDGKYTVYEMMINSAELSEFSNQKLSAIAKKMVEDGTIEKIIERKKSYFAITGYSKKIEEKLERKKKEKEEKQHQREYELRIKCNEIDEEIKEKEKEIKEQKEIVELNKGKLFGAGARARKEAQQKVTEIEKQLDKLAERKSAFEDPKAYFEQRKIKDMRDIEALESLRLYDDDEIIFLKEIIKYREDDNEINSVNISQTCLDDSSLTEVYKQKQIVHSRQPRLELALVDLYVSDKKIFIQQKVEDRSWRYVFDETAITMEFDNLSMNIKNDKEVIKYKNITSVNIHSEVGIMIWDADFNHISIPNEPELNDTILRWLKKKINPNKIQTK
ncbi:hypothetical protein ACTNB0_08695 [Lachnospiraceae bacterium HCP28S3_F9]